MVLCLAATARDSDESGRERHLRADGHEQQCRDAQCERAALSHECVCGRMEGIAAKISSKNWERAEEAILSRWWSSATRRRKNERDGELGPQVQPPCVPAVLFACFVCVGGMWSFLCP